MSIATTLFSDVTDAFKTAFDAVGVSFYPYESAGLMKVPCATMVPDQIDEIEMLDQAARIGRMRWSLRYYVAMSKDARQAWDDFEQGITKCVDAVGRADDGAAVRAAWIEQARMSPIVTHKNKLELMCEFDVVVVPAVNASS